MMRRPLNAIARAVARLAGVPPRAKPDAQPLCASEADHEWEAAWIGDDLVYWRCTKCPAVRESFGEVEVLR